MRGGPILSADPLRCRPHSKFITQLETIHHQLKTKHTTQGMSNDHGWWNEAYSAEDQCLESCNTAFITSASLHSCKNATQFSKYISDNTLIGLVGTGPKMRYAILFWNLPGLKGIKQRYGIGNPTVCLFFLKVAGDDNYLETLSACIWICYLYHLYSMELQAMKATWVSCTSFSHQAYNHVT